MISNSSTNCHFFQEFKTLLLILQCLHDVAEGKETLHLFTHYINRSTIQLHGYLKDWMDHTTFVGKVGSSILSWKGISTQDYIYLISQIGQPLDEIGLFLVARMYHIHVAIIQDKRYWATRWDHNLDLCTIVFR